MSAKRQGEVLHELAEEVRNLRIQGGPVIRQAFVEPYVDADGEAALRAMIILDKPGEDGWSADFTHVLRRQVNRLAAARHLDEHVYVTLFTEEEFETREDADEPVKGNSIDPALTREQQDRP